MQLDYIRAFVSAASHASITKAAATLGLSKSTVSEHIRSLERDLGSKLLLTTTRKVSLTPVGRTYYEECARLLTELAAAGARVKELQSRPTGTLRIAAPVEMTNHFLSPHLLAFSEMYPEIPLELSLSSQNIDLLKGDHDLALRMGSSADGDLVARPIATFKRHLFASHAYLRRMGKPERPLQLTNHRCIVFPQLGPATTLTLSRGKQSIDVQVGGSLSVNNIGFVFESIVRGYGIGVLPQFMSVRAEADGLICKILPDWKVAGSTLSLVIPSRKVLARTRVFIDFLQARLGS
jgi:DNA-binding transcriptional LysR family regulator